MLPSRLGRREKMVTVEQAVEALLETSWISGEFRLIEGSIDAKHRGLCRNCEQVVIIELSVIRRVIAGCSLPVCQTSHRSNTLHSSLQMRQSTQGHIRLSHQGQNMTLLEYEALPFAGTTTGTAVRYCVVQSPLFVLPTVEPAPHVSPPFVCY